MKNTIFTGAGVAIATPMSADGSIVYNPSAADVWASCGGEAVCLKGGEAIKL